MDCCFFRHLFLGIVRFCPNVLFCTSIVYLKMPCSVLLGARAQQFLSSYFFVVYLVCRTSFSSYYQCHTVRLFLEALDLTFYLLFFVFIICFLVHCSFKQVLSRFSNLFLVIWVIIFVLYLLSIVGFSSLVRISVCLGSCFIELVVYLFLAIAGCLSL